MRYKKKITFEKYKSYERSKSEDVKSVKPSSSVMLANGLN